MLILVGHATTPDKLKLISSAAGDLDVYVSYIDCTDASPPVPKAPNKQATNIVTAATTDILAGTTTATDRRNIKNVSIRNVSPTITQDVTVVIDAIDGLDYELHKATLAPGERLGYDEGIGWFETGTAMPAAVYNALLAAMAAGFVADTYVTNSNLLIGGRLKLQSILRWSIHMTKTAAGAVAPSVIIRFGTAGAIADTARVTMAGPVQTGVVDEAVLSIEAVVWTAGVSGIVRGQMGIQHAAAVAAGFGEMFDGITSAAFDLTVGNLQAGISMVGGTAAAWTVNEVIAEAVNLA